MTSSRQIHQHQVTAYPHEHPSGVGRADAKKLNVEAGQARAGKSTTEFDEHRTVDQTSTPSTSPVREPPPEELMIEGLDADDQYIMVEDEFLATAQAFTAHLHQAEYTRKKKQAKAEHATKVINITQQRPTDTRTPMSNETRKNIEREASAARHQAALDKMKREAGRPLVDSELEDNVDEGASEEDRDDDPWVGTSLQPLMVASRQPRPLVGLQGIWSSTKAALGYSQPTETSGAPGKGNEATLKARPRPAIIDDATASSDDDDLDVQARITYTPSRPLRTKTPAAIPRPRKAASPSTSTSPTRPGPRPSPIKRPHVNTSRCQTTSGSPSSACRKRSLLPTPRGSSSSSSRFAKFFDELDEPAKEPGPGPSPARRQVTSEGIDPPLSRVKPFTSRSEKTGDRDQDDEKLRIQRLDQVPTFL
ncbi:uncharacterized protein GIQ15_04970 [Arthroderma uncinatum]|uniref:uncharacterized protein n=1 Tax=Arthroderma uncinatum TaxID=74035 RepID=UPI00144A790F|nr:uncharacterized protein GIQ15_04970 [Arthroderma uncinatum]KAF3482211.1 hypothetical protein GIQ15_04970 [Arthroderma uncinatum]